MTLRLAIEVTAQKDGVTRDIREVRADIKSLGSTATAANNQAVNSARASTAATRQATNAFKEQATTAQRAAGASAGFNRGLATGLAQVGRYRTQIQGLGYQVGDLAVQIASGQNALVAFTQQGGQALQLFGGPWGAVFGAVLSIVGALSIAFFNLSGATKSATEAQEEYVDAIDGAKDLLRTSKENAEARAQAELNVAKAKLAVVIATQKEVAAEAQAKAARLEGVVARRAIGRDPRADLAAAEAQADRATAKIREAEELLAKLNDPSKLGSAREAAADAAKAQADDFEQLMEQLDRERAQIEEQFRNSFDTLLDKIDPVAGATRALAKDQAVLAEAYIEGMFGITGSAEALERYNQALGHLSNSYKDKLDPLAKLNREQDIQLAKLDAELRAIGMTDIERAKANATLEAENKLRAENISLSDPAAQAYIREAQAIAERDAAQRDQIESMAAGQREAEQFIDQSADRIGNALTEGFARGEISAVNFFDVLRAGASEAIQWLLKLAAINPIKNWITGGNLPTLGSILGGGGGGGLTIQTASGQAVGGIGGGSSGFGGLSLGGLLGGGSTGIGTMLFGSAATPVMSNGIQVGLSPGTAGLFGSGGGGSFGSFLNTPFGGGLATAGLSFGLALLSGQDLLPAGITAGLTGIGTAIGGPIGGVVGGLLGSIFGGLFGKKKPKLKKYEAEAFIEANQFGLPVLDIEREDGKLGNLGNDLAKLARTSIGDLLGSVGALMPDNVRSRLSYYRSTKGGKTKSEFYKASLYDTGIKGLTGEIGRYQDAETAAQSLAAGTLFMAGLTGDIQGTGASTGQAFQNLWKQAGRKVGNISQYDAEMLTETINFTKWLDGMDKVRTESDAAAKALLDLNSQLNKLNSQAEDLGLDTSKVLDAMKRDFAESIGDELLQLTDPEAFALRELEKEYAARKAVAEQLGVDLVELEKLYAMKRQQIIDQGLQGAAGSWKDFINQLQFGQASALSPTQQLENARLQYEAAKGQALNGGSGVAFQEAATNYLGILQGYYGGTRPYAEVYEEIIALAKQFGALADVPGFAGGGDHPGGWMWINEQGPELVATGRARVFNARETAEILNPSKVDRRIAALRSANENGARQGGGGASDGLAVAHLVNTLGGKFDVLAQEQNRLNRNLRRLIESGRQRA